jgi:hypothetical protein
MSVLAQRAFTLLAAGINYPAAGRHDTAGAPDDALPIS